MANDSGYFSFILEQLEHIPGISGRRMMGDHIIYCRDKVVSIVCDNMFLVKDTPTSAALLPNAEMVQPFPGAKLMRLVEDMENRELMQELIEGIYSELPPPAKKRPKKK